MVVTLLAILELLKQHLIEMVQSEVFGPIHVKAAGQSASNDSGNDNDTNNQTNDNS